MILMGKSLWRGVQGSVVFAALASNLLAATVELEPTADVSMLYSATPPFHQNLLNGGTANIGASVHDGVDRGSCSLLRFDIGKIPKGAKILSVRLLLFPVYSYPKSVYEAQECLCVYQLAAENAGWVEGSGTTLADESAPASVPGANGAYVNMDTYTDDDHQHGTSWLSGHHIGLMDFDGDELASYSLEDQGLVKDQSIEIGLPPKLIENWQRNSSLAEAGLALWMTSTKQEVAASRFAIFQSRETNSGPRLIVEYQ